MKNRKKSSCTNTASHVKHFSELNGNLIKFVKSIFKTALLKHTLHTIKPTFSHFHEPPTTGLSQSVFQVAQPLPRAHFRRFPCVGDLALRWAARPSPPAGAPPTACLRRLPCCGRVTAMGPHSSQDSVGCLAASTEHSFGVHRGGSTAQQLAPTGVHREDTLD